MGARHPFVRGQMVEPHSCSPSYIVIRTRTVEGGVLRRPEPERQRGDVAAVFLLACGVVILR